VKPSNDDLELVRGGDNPFRDVGLPDADAELMKADLAAAIVRIIREREMTGGAAAHLSQVQESEISRIRRGSLDRFTIDRLVKIHNRLDQDIRVRVGFDRPRDGERVVSAHT
jgi:predicted XRE-type DNA-binding protein